MLAAARNSADADACVGSETGRLRRRGAADSVADRQLTAAIVAALALSTLDCGVDAARKKIHHQTTQI